MPIGTVAARRAWQPPPPPHTPPPTPAEGFNEMHLDAAKVMALSGIYIYIYINIYIYIYIYTYTYTHIYKKKLAVRPWGQGTIPDMTASF
jgi:hypothetical protein